MEEIKKVRLRLVYRPERAQYQTGGDVADRSTPSVTCTGTGAAGGGATLGEACADVDGDGEVVADGVAATGSGRYHNWKCPVRPVGAK
jgi:hypothetical protein